MKINQNRLKQIIKESIALEAESAPVGEQRVDVIKQLITDMDFEHNHFLRGLIEEFGLFLPDRQDSLEEELKMALVQVLIRAEK